MRQVILAAFLLAIVAAFWAFQQWRDGETDTSHRSERESSNGNDTASPLEDYLRFIDAGGNSAADAYAFIVEGLRKLAGAVGDLNLGTLDVQVRLRVAAEHVLLNPDAPATTEAVRDALISAAEAIEAGSNRDGELRQLAVSLRVDHPLATQQETTLAFFRTSADALRRVSRI